MSARVCGLLLAASIGAPDSLTARAWRSPQMVEHSAGCRALNWTPLAATEAGYSEAHAVAARLSAIGVAIRCIAPSKMAEWFEGQQGAAIFDTNAGRFDILFLPSGRTFDPLKVVGKEVAGVYHYSIEGALPGRPPRIESPRRVYFSIHGNKLVVTQDVEVVLRIANALENR